MNEKKGIKVSLLTVSLIIAIIVIIIMGYFIYKLYNDKEAANSEIANLNNQVSNLEESKSDLKETTNNTENISSNDEKNADSYSVLELSPIGGTAVVYKGEVYVNVDDSTTNIDDTYGEGEYQTLVKTRKLYNEYSFGNLKINNEETKWMKLNVSNVKAIYNNDYGQALDSDNPKYGIIMLNNDNTVSYISTRDLIEGNINVTQLNVSDIIDIVREDDGGYTTNLVDKDGKKVDVNDYIH